MRLLSAAALTSACALFACGTGLSVSDPVDGGALEKKEPLPVPSVRLVSPPTWSAGGVITVLGEDFVEPSRGHTLVVLDGNFTTEDGQSSSVKMQEEARFVNRGRVEFTFDPDYPPSGFGNQIGTFHGELWAVNADDEEASEPATPIVVTVNVGPSLIVWKVGPDNRSCANDKVMRTLSGSAIRVEVQAIGLEPATPYTPLAFSASWVDIDGKSHASEQHLTSGSSVRFVLDFGSLPEGEVEATGLANLTVEDGYGKRLTRSVQVSFAQPYRVSYDGNVRVAELYAPVQVSSCLPGGEYGRQVSYTGGHSESRSRSVSFSVNVGISLWIVNAGFTFNVTDTVSSETSESLSMSGTILPDQYGVFYRQTERLERTGQIIQRTLCGDESVIGIARVTDWDWAPDLAITKNGTCPPAPPSNLPPAQVLN